MHSTVTKYILRRLLSINQLKISIKLNQTNYENFKQQSVNKQLHVNKK